MKLLKEHLNNEETHDVFVNEGNVESVQPIADGVSQVRMIGGVTYQVRGEAAEVAATLKTASTEAMHAITESLIPALANIGPTLGSIVNVGLAGSEAAPPA